MNEILKKNKGITLIELLVALVISGLLVAALYRTFIGQQKTFVVQEQVVDMQQNMRAAIHRMMTEIRMAGFGNVSMVFNEIVTPSNNSLTIRSATEAVGAIANPDPGDEAKLNEISQKKMKVSDATVFAVNDYISIGGVESQKITAIDSVKRIVTLERNLIFSHPVNTSIYRIEAISYQVVDNTLQRNGIALADNIENLQFDYFDASGNPTATPGNIRIVRVALTARTEMSDPEFNGGDGFRRRQIASNIHLRNMGIGL